MLRTANGDGSISNKNKQTKKNKQTTKMKRQTIKTKKYLSKPIRDMHALKVQEGTEE
jgi:hypothetical protein